MKNILLIILFLKSFSIDGQTNVYHSFPDSNAVWNFNYSIYCGFGGMVYGRDYSIILSGDTLIGSQIYHKLKRPFIENINAENCGVPQIGYLGAIRQDTLAKKVFFFPPAENEETLLYDFNMEVGDTVRGFIGLLEPDTVEYIDSVFVGNSYRKRWMINSCYGIQIIEGIGSTYGLIVNSPGCNTDQVGYSLNCFKDDEIIYIENPELTLNCDIITSFDSSGSLDELNIFPNPSQGTFNIRNERLIKKILLTDVAGKVLIVYLPDNKTELILEGIEVGMYILTVIDYDDSSKSLLVISSP